MFNIEKYKFLLDSHSFDIFLHKLLPILKENMDKFLLENAFIAYLDEMKIEDRFEIVSSIGRFHGENDLNLISSKEIDILSVAYISKKSFFKNNIYVDVVEKDSKILFLYLEFESILTKSDTTDMEIFFDNLTKIMIGQNWSIDEKHYS